MADDQHGSTPTDPTESFQQNDFAPFLKVMFYGLIIWGLAYSAYFLIIDFDSEARFDKRAGAAVEMQAK